MRSVRLSEKLEKELDELSSKTQKSRSLIIKEALTEYIAKAKKFDRPFESGEKYFGKRGSGEKDRSTTYKSRIKERIREKKPD